VAGAGSMSPFQAYLMLRQVQGELAALAPDRDPFEAPKFDHDAPGPVFQELDRRIRPLLRGDIQRKFLQTAFVKDQGLLVASLTDEQVSQPNGYYIGVRTKANPTVLGKLVEDQDRFKLMPKSMAKLHLFGVKLLEERHPPMELPSSIDLHYFRVDMGESKKMWDRIVAEKAMSLRWAEADDFEFQDISLYMTVP
jgi:type VI secretion system protein ImpJ